MRKLLLLIAMFGLVKMAAAQDDVQSAYSSYVRQQPDKAKEYIDKAMTQDKYLGEAKTWHYRGAIYLQVFEVAHMTDMLKKGTSADNIKNFLGDPVNRRNYKKLENGERWFYNYDLVIYLSNGKLDHYDYPDEALYRSLDDGNSLEVAYQSFEKALELNPNFISMSISPQSPAMGIEKVAGSYYNGGILAFQAGHFKEAYKNFDRAYTIYNEIGKAQPVFAFYTAVAATSAKDTADAIKYYEIAASKKYEEKILYYNLANLYLAQSRIKEAKEALKKGRELYPEDQDLLITEANIYLQNNEAKAAEQILLKAVEKDPTNYQLYFVIGANYDNIINDTNSTTEQRENGFEQAQKAYMKAIELKPDYFDALFNMGALLNNKAAEILVDAGNLPLEETDKYNKMKDEALQYLKKAEPYLAKAHELNPKDKDTMVLLKQIYMKTNNTEKFKEINNALKNL